jgi:hypothetical protein
MGKVVEELDSILRKTDFICADCGDAITYMDEVFRLEVVRPWRYEGQTLHSDVTDEHHPEEGFVYEPYYFCYRCWEKNYEEVQNDMRDELPVEDPFSRNFECVNCASGIRDGELAGVFTLGEFHVSERAPNGVRGQHFVPIGNPDMICIYCLTILNEGYIDMWQYLSENYECDDCIQARCWRLASHGLECECRCHHEPEEEVEEDTFPYQPYT